MNREIKSIGLAVAAVPVAFAILGVLEKLEIIESDSPSAWSNMKLVVVLCCGFAYLAGKKIFKGDDSEGG